jgi:hypothetical protein
LDDVSHYLFYKYGNQLIDKISEKNEINGKCSKNDIKEYSEHAITVVDRLPFSFPSAPDLGAHPFPGIITIQGSLAFFSIIFLRIIIQRLIIELPWFRPFKERNIHDRRFWQKYG